MDLISENVILAELVDQYPLASKVMLKHGLDFCCGGQSSLADACESLKIDINMVIDELRPCLVQAPTQSWSTAPTEELVTHILDCYHASLYENLPHLQELINRVVEAHGEKDNQSLHALKKLLFDVSGELIEHMEKEEQILFPWILSKRQPRPIEPIQCMLIDHKRVSSFLTEIAKLTDNFQPPNEACATWRNLYACLQSLDHQLRIHIHLENNILFPRTSR